MGKILLKVPNLKSFPQIILKEEGNVTKIRGILHSTKVSPSILNSIIESVRSIMNNYLSDIYIFIDPMNEKNADDSPGFGISLVAETTTKCYISAENVAVVEGTKQLFSPEEITKTTSIELLKEVNNGGVVDSTQQGMLLLLCAIGAKALHQVRLGPLTKRTFAFLRQIDETLGLKFKISPEVTNHTVILSCIGIHVQNSVSSFL